MTPRTFKLSETFLEQYKEQEPDWGPLGEVTFLRTYSRKVDEGTPMERNEAWWEAVRRIVEGTFNIQKEYVQSLKLPWNNDKAKRSAQKMYDKIFNFKFLPPGRGLWLMGTDFIKEKGSAGLNNPLHPSTRMLTKEYGWVEIGDIEGEEVTVLSSTKKYGRDNSQAANPIWVPAQISNFEVQPTKKITYKSRYGDTHEVIASVNHRWFRKRYKSQWERVTTDELNVGDYLPRVSQKINLKLSYEGARHGFFFGDGTRSNGELHQFGANNISVLKQLFTNVEDVDDGHSVVRQLPYAWSETPKGKYLEDKRYVYGFLSGYFAADGSMRTSRQSKIDSARRDELEEIKRLFELVGVRTKEIQDVSRPSNYKEDRELYSLPFYVGDLQEEFFLKETHKEKYRDFKTEASQDWMKVVGIEDSGEHEVICATVPEYEQFVIEGNVLTSNCGMVSTDDIATRGSWAFEWTMDALMMGVGIGFDTKGAGKITIQEPKENSGLVYNIPDDREGWVTSLGMLLDAFFNGREKPKFEYHLIRPEGAPIRGFGGVASGPGPLRLLHERVDNLLSARMGEKIKSTDIVDIMNMIGACVVAGNVRRSAEIALGNANDVEFTTMKDYDKHPKEMTSHRWASNNSIFAEVGKTDYSKIVDSIALNGEPGVVWLDNLQRYGRLKDGETWADRNAVGTNPCGEQTLESGELCCLVETFPSRHESFDEYKETLKYAYLYGKTVTLLPTHWEETNAVLMKNRRIGTSQSGIIDAFVRHGRRTMIEWSDEAYSYLRALDKKYSDWLAIPQSIKITSVKPSGTVSLLPGVSPGIHYQHSQYYIRRMRIPSNSPLIPVLKEAGYEMEYNHYGETEEEKKQTTVVSFPIYEENFAKRKDDVSIWEQMKNLVDYQRVWADNSVSITVTFKPNEAKDLATVLEAYEDSLKAVSFLPISEHGYKQAPYEEITKERYEEMESKITKPDFSKMTGALHALGSKYCDSDHCEV